MPKRSCNYHLKNDEVQKTECKCPVPCSEVIFTPTLSYSALSDVKLQQLLMHESIVGIKDKYNKALEIREQVVPANQ